MMMWRPRIEADCGWGRFVETWEARTVMHLDFLER
jgi:hypothetical protein